MVFPLFFFSLFDFDMEKLYISQSGALCTVINDTVQTYSHNVVTWGMHVTAPIMQIFGLDLLAHQTALRLLMYFKVTEHDALLLQNT